MKIDVLRAVSKKTNEIIEQKATAIRGASISVDRLVARSEDLRTAMDDFETSLNRVVNSSVQLSKGDRIRERLLAIRRARNGMECFALKCLAAESLDKAWKELP